MEFVLLIAPVAVIGTGFGRWTRWHPLAIGAAPGLLPGALGVLFAAAFATQCGAILLFGAVAFVSGSWAAGVAAYVGWLRRKHIERNI